MRTQDLFKDNCVLNQSELEAVSVGVNIGRVSPLQLLRTFRFAQANGVSLASIPGIASKLRGKGGLGEYSAT